MSIEAMEQALEALIQIRTPLRVNTSLDAYYVGRAITSLRQAIAEAEKQEPVGYAGVRVWVGDQQVCRVLTQLELHRAVSPWRTVEMAAMACIAKLREKNS